jgi:hypothetical protein
LLGAAKEKPEGSICRDRGNRHQTGIAAFDVAPACNDPASTALARGSRALFQGVAYV